MLDVENIYYNKCTTFKIKYFKNKKTILLINCLLQNILTKF